MQPIKIRHGDSNAILILLQEALRSGEDFSHLVLLSGTDYPIKKMSFINEVFSQNGQHEFIKYFNVNSSYQYRAHIYQKWFKEPLFITTNKQLQFVPFAAANFLSQSCPVFLK